jgi:hypothetical protein
MQKGDACAVQGKKIFKQKTTVRSIREERGKENKHRYHWHE